VAQHRADHPEIARKEQEERDLAAFEEEFGVDLHDPSQWEDA